MLIKDIDSKDNDIAKLEELLKSKNLTDKQKNLIKKEINAIKKGIQGEKDSAYYINFYFKDSKNWVVIHDLRIEHNKEVAQIDHILINRFLDIYILESKNYSYNLEVNEFGEFQLFKDDKTFGIPSPIEQNKRHQFLFSKFLEDKNLLPKRLSIPIKPKFYTYVLISPSSVIKRANSKDLDELLSQVIKADTIRKVIDKNVDKIGVIETFTSASKMVSIDTVIDFAKKIVSYHKPLEINWENKFRFSNNQNKTKEEIKKSKPSKTETKTKEQKRYFCAKCKKTISEKEAKYCFGNKDKFKGKAYCFNCQKTV